MSPGGTCRRRIPTTTAARQSKTQTWRSHARSPRAGRASRKRDRRTGDQRKSPKQPGGLHLGSLWALPRLASRLVLALCSSGHAARQGRALGRGSRERKCRDGEGRARYKSSCGIALRRRGTLATMPARALFSWKDSGRRDRKDGRTGRRTDRHRFCRLAHRRPQRLARRSSILVLAQHKVSR